MCKTHRADTRCRLQAVELPLKAAQTAALLEVVHSAVGLVRSPVAITGVPAAAISVLPPPLLPPLTACTGSSCLAPLCVW